LPIKTSHCKRRIKMLMSHAETGCTSTFEENQNHSNKKDSYFRNKRIHGGTFKNAFLYIDETCNMNCKHCYLGNRLNNPGKMSIKEIMTTLEYFKAIGTRKCTIIGGEPTCSKNLFETIKMINECGFDCILDTNGWFKAEEILALIDVNDLEYISFSLDGSNAEMHDSIRRPGSFTRTLENIMYAVNKGFEVRIIPTITRKNQNEAGAMLALAQSLGVKKVNFHTITMIGNAKKNQENDDQTLQPDEWVSFYRNLEKINQDYQLKVWYPPTYAFESDIERFRMQGYQGCVGRTLDRLSVFPGGESYICSLLFDENQRHGGKTNAFYGVMDKGNLKLNHSHMNEVNHFFDRPEKCVDCKYAELCRMGCPAQRLIGQENFCGKDHEDNKLIPMCRLWKAQVMCN
jgi:radical SAM protein with 4Fe4S-binding SPASM domain